ncbi:hypothetical protein [Limnothrix sp. FACHB-881]
MDNRSEYCLAADGLVDELKNELNDLSDLMDPLDPLDSSDYEPIE